MMLPGHVIFGSTVVPEYIVLGEQRSFLALHEDTGALNDLCLEIERAARS